MIIKHWGYRIAVHNFDMTCCKPWWLQSESKFMPRANASIKTLQKVIAGGA